MAEPVAAAGDSRRSPAVDAAAAATADPAATASSAAVTSTAPSASERSELTRSSSEPPAVSPVEVAPGPEPVPASASVASSLTAGQAPAPELAGAEAHADIPLVSSASTTAEATAEVVDQAGASGDADSDSNEQNVNHAAPDDAASLPADSTLAAGPPAPTPTATDLPCMRGQLVVEASGAHVLAGTWGMTAAAHDIEGQTSPFELKMAAPKAGKPPHAFPSSGNYTGFFFLMRPGGQPPLKVDEKGVALTLIQNAAGGFNVQGAGKNRFGAFVVTGTIAAADGASELFRRYLPKPLPKESKDSKKRPAAVAGAPAAQRAKAGLQVSAADSAAADPPLSGSLSPRSPGGGLGGKSIQSLSELSKPPDDPQDNGTTPGGRSKRATAGDWKDKADIPANREAGSSEHRAPERKGKGKEHSAAASAAAGDGRADEDGAPAGSGVPVPGASAGGASIHGRTRKIPAHLKEPPEERTLVSLNQHLRKCLAVLRDVSKQPAAHWFAAPVDWKALNLLDYPNVVKKPMDLGTVKSKVETGQLETPDAFKDCVLLVFRNAMVYNTKKDNVVHMAAQELKAFFEEKYRTVVEPLGPMPSKDAAAVAAVQEKEAGSSSGKGNRKGKPAANTAKPGPRDEASGSGSSTPRVRVQSQGGGGGGGVPAGMVPKAQFMALQQQMELMQQQLAELKRQTSQTDMNMQAQQQLAPVAVAKKPAEDKPLSEADKETLKAGINALPEDKLPRVVEIIKERSAHVDERDAEIEVDLDALDASTLRHLQRYVKSCAQKKRKAPGGGAGSRGGGGGGGGDVWSNQLLPSPALPDGLEMDLGNLEADALDGFDGTENDDAKRARPSADPSLGMLDWPPI